MRDIEPESNPAHVGGVEGIEKTILFIGCKRFPVVTDRDDHKVLFLAGHAAQLNLLEGDIDGNAATIISAAADAEKKGAQLIVFSELALTGSNTLQIDSSRVSEEGNTPYIYEK